MKFFDPNQISAEENRLSKVDLIEPVITAIPYNSLPDRNFEILVYRLFEKNIPDVYKDSDVAVHLMEGVGDQGRDVSFVLKGKIDGVVQCKNWKSKFTKPALIKEIIKTALFMKKEGTLQYFNKYWIVAPEGCTSDAKTLIRNFSSLIKHEKIEDLFNQVTGEYETFNGFSYENESKDLLALFERIHVLEITRIELDSLLEGTPNVKKMHFKLNSIIDCETNQKMIDSALERFGERCGLKMFTDVDLNILKENIEKIPEEYRTRLLGFDVFGLPQEMFGTNSADELDFLQAAVTLWSKLNIMVMNKIVDEIQNHINSQITIPLVHPNKVHPYSVFFCAPYITKCTIFVINENSMPISVYGPINRDDVEKECKGQIVSAASCVFNNDYSSFTGDALLVQKKKLLMKLSLNGLNSIEDVVSQLDKDLGLLKPICDKIIDSLLEKYKYPKTVVIHDLSIWKDSKYMDNAVKTLQKFK